MEHAIPRIGTWRLEDLYRQYYQQTFRVCLRYMKSAEEAHEMTQETFINVNRGLGSFQGLSSPMTWIYRIAVNLCLTRLASRRREREGIVRYFDESRTAPDGDDGDKAFRRLEAENLLKDANQVTRRILYLYFGDGLTQSQIAVSLGVSRVAVTRRINRFRNKAVELRRTREASPPMETRALARQAA